jgi:enterobactin synthetase component D
MNTILDARTLPLGQALFAHVPERLRALRAAMQATAFDLARETLHVGVPIDAVARSLPFIDRAALPDACRTMAPRRLHGFIAGRLCAEALLERVGTACGIGRGAAGQPLWPAGLTGSIAHTEATAFAAVSSQRVDVGIDAEPLPDAAGVAAIRAECCNERERTWLSAGNGGAALAAAALFCAKEAYYKAIHRRVQRVVEFGEVEASGFDGRSLQIAPRSGLGAPPAVASIALHGGVVHAAVVIAA